jgi:hypothetical protein
MLFWSSVMLALEAAKVIETRLHLIAQGKCTMDEFLLMFSEKLGALEHANGLIARGEHPELIIDNYRKVVAANATRLTQA